LISIQILEDENMIAQQSPSASIEDEEISGPQIQSPSFEGGEFSMPQTENLSFEEIELVANIPYQSSTEDVPILDPEFKKKNSQSVTIEVFLNLDMNLKFLVK
jgi:hypothetical protein